MNYETILSEMNAELNEFSKTSNELNGYQYEKQFREITDRYNQKLFEASQGEIPKSKNSKHKLQTSFGEIEVKKKGTH